MATFTIDPTNLRREEMRLMWEYLYPKKGILNNLLVNLKFRTQDEIQLIQSEPQVAGQQIKKQRVALHHSTPDIDYYIVHGTQKPNYLGSGSGYSVFRASGILKVNKKTKEITFEKQENFVYMDPKKRDSEDFVADISIAKQVPYMHLEVLRKTPVGLACKAKYLGKTYPNLQADNLLDNIETAINYIRALQAVHDLGITHRDVKPDNFTKNTKGSIKAIDFNLARKTNIDDNNPDVGSHCYVAPDFITQIGTPLANTTLSDTYSMGIILFQLFGGTGRGGRPETIFNGFQNQREQINTNTLFENISFPINNKIQPKIRSIILGLLNFVPQGRMTLDEALEKFLEIKHDILVVRFDLPTRIKYKNALKIGASTHRELSKIKYLAEGAVDRIQNIILNNLTKIEDTDCIPVIKCFVDESGVKAFKGLETKQQISDATTQILSTFKDGVSHLLDAHDTLVALKSITKNSNTQKTVNALIIEANSLLGNAAKCTHKLDGIKKYNTNYGNRAAELIEGVKKIKDKINPNTPNNDNAGVSTLIDHLSNKPNATINTSLKIRIRKAIQTYLKETLTLKNLKNKSRAASSDRTKTVNEIMALLNNNTENLDTKIREKLNTMKFGFFGSFGSRLYTLVDKALEAEKLATDRTELKSKARNFVGSLRRVSNT